jgi:hypothetical protein
MKKVLMFCSISALAFLLTFGLNSCQHDEITVSEPEDSIEEMIQFGLEHLDVSEQLEVFRKDGKLDWGVSRNTTLGIRKHDCSGSAMSVAKCAGKIMDAGGCVLAGKDANGTYWADKVKCP